MRESPPRAAASPHRKPLDQRPAGFRVLWDARPTPAAGGPLSRGHGTPKAPAGPKETQRVSYGNQIID